jgi:hypothetical protein
LFSRDEAYGLIEHLSNIAMEKLLKSTATDPAPGLAEGGTTETSSHQETLVENTSDTDRPLMRMLEQNKRNLFFQNVFSLPSSETLIKQMSVVISVAGGKASCQGTLFLSSSFICFVSLERYQCHLSVPYFTVLKVERIQAANFSLSLTLRNQLQLIFQFFSEKHIADAFCDTLKECLQKNTPLMKQFKGFLLKCASEEILAGNEVTCSGLGMKFGYVESKEYFFCY